MKEHDIKKVFELAKYNQLELLQWKVQYLTEEVNMLEATSDILKLNSAINQLESSLPLPQRGEERMNQERRWFDGSSNSYPITYQQPNTDWYSLDISYKYE
jgi:hypothetical protein